MQAWLHDHSLLAADSARLEAERAELTSQERVRDTHRATLATQLTAAGQASDPDAPLGVLLDLAEQTLDAHAQAAAAGQRRRERQDDLEAQHRDATEAATRAATGLSEWTGASTRALAEIELPQQLSTDQVRVVVEALEYFHSAREDATQLQRRIDGIERDHRGFEDSARELAERLAPELSRTPRRPDRGPPPRVRRHSADRPGKPQPTGAAARRETS